MFKTNSLESVQMIAKCLENPTYEIKGTIKEVAPLLHTEFWPAAVPSGLIVTNEEHSKMRARSILYSYEIAGAVNKQSLLNQQPARVLDYGCGAGHVVLAAREMGIHAYGYDIDQKWQLESDYLSTNLDYIKQFAPYSHILIYDVIDHTEEQLTVLKNVAELSDSNTKISLRTHPWTSRHAAHTYYKLNKAYAHLFLSDDELAQYTQENVVKTTRPIKHYKDLIERAGLKIMHTETINKPLDQFFLNAQIIECLSKVLSNSSREWIETVLSIEFVDYKLSI